ncbi:SIMPL domain-containing protein [Arthrobacter liuii]|uniref:SIMPL domain-containing protein n=2 Tax=Arthrobacter liuii TaxID=1476996 RepID=UPI0035EAFA3F
MGQETHVHGDAGTVTATGTGWAEAAPDQMLVSVGVECRAESVDEAYEAAGERLAAVDAVLRSRGIAPADIRSAGLSVRADLAWRDGEGQKLVGYVAASNLTVRLRDIEHASTVVSEAVRAAGDTVRLNNFQLVLSDESAVRAEARDAAWQDALRTAEQYGALASATLGRVLSIADQRPAPGSVPLAGLQRASAAEDLAVEPGQNRVEAAVTVTWELRH